jgi:hypothetical protein
MGILGGTGGIILGLRWKKKDDLIRKQDNMSATIMTTDDGAIAMIIVDGCIVPNVQFVNMNELLRGEGEQGLDDEI